MRLALWLGFLISFTYIFWTRRRLWRKLFSNQGLFRLFSIVILYAELRFFLASAKSYKILMKFRGYHPDSKHLCFKCFELEGNQLYRNMQTTFCMLEVFVYMHYNAICYQKSIANLGITWSFPRDLIQHEMLCGIRNTHKVLNAIWRPWIRHTSTRQFIADINILCRCWWKYHFFKIDRLG